MSEVPPRILVSRTNEPDLGADSRTEKYLQHEWGKESFVRGVGEALVRTQEGPSSASTKQRENMQDCKMQLAASHQPTSSRRGCHRASPCPRRPTRRRSTLPWFPRPLPRTALCPSRALRDYCLFLRQRRRWRLSPLFVLCLTMTWSQVGRWPGSASRLKRDPRTSEPESDIDIYVFSGHAKECVLIRRCYWAGEFLAPL